MTRTLALFASICIAVGPLAMAEIRVVDPSAPPGTYATVQAAIDAAVDGDIVLVKSGQYTGLQIVDKALTVVADTDASVVVRGMNRVAQLAPGKRVVLSGLELIGSNLVSIPNLNYRHGLMLENNAGSIRIESCSISGSAMFFECATRAGVQVENCADVAVSNSALQGNSPATCQSSGGTSQIWSNPGGAGLKAIASRTALFDSVVRGGRGGNGSLGQVGGAGLEVVGGSVFVSGGEFYGGQGGTGISGTFPCNGSGGPGMSFTNVAPGDSVVVGVVALVGGAKGEPFWYECAHEQAGPPSVGGPSVTLDGPARGMTFPTPVRGGESFDITFHGERYDVALVGMGSGDVHVPVLPFHGVLLVLELGTPWLTVLDADGVGTITLTVPAAGAATAGRVLRLQCGFVTTQIDIRLGSARHQIVLPAGL